MRALWVLALCAATPFGDASAVLIESGDGSGNTSAPADDPGWAHVGTRNNLSVVYLGRRWVLTANHVGVGNVVIDGQLYAPVPGSAVQFENPDTSLVDLLAFKIFGDPNLPRLALASEPPAVGDPLVAIGHGRNRGSATSFMGFGGYNWGGGNSMRWGTNLVSEIDVVVDTTRSFAATFSDPLDFDATADEAAGANGDSGGAVFIEVEGSWRLAGTIFAISQYAEQPSTTSIYGNELFAVDLSFYRDDILAVVNQRSCADGLDDDGDGLADYPADPECTSSVDDSESMLEEAVPALGPLASALLIGSLLAARAVLDQRDSRRRASGSTFGSR